MQDSCEGYFRDSKEGRPQDVNAFSDISQASARGRISFAIFFALAQVIFLVIAFFVVLSQPSLGPVPVFVLWAGADAFGVLIFSLWARGMVDWNGNGKVDIDELPQLSSFSETPKLDGGFFDIGLMAGLQLLIESWSFAAAYGYLVVASLNHLLPVGQASPRLEYLIVTNLVYYSCVYMCAFAENTIHVATSHIVHFVYYSCGLLPILLYARLPEPWWLVIAYIIVRMVLNTLMKYYVWPQYPAHYEVFPLYRVMDGEVVRVHKPGIDPPPSFSTIFKSALPIPVYEIVHGNILSALTYGGLVTLCGGDCWVTLLIAAVYVSPLCTSLYWDCKWASVRRFYPRLQVLICMPLGAALVRQEVWVGAVAWHSIHIVVTVTLLFVYPMAASRKHLAAKADYGQAPTQPVLARSLSGALSAVIGGTDPSLHAPG